MLQFGNKEFRNLQEQVLKNMRDIQDIEEGATVLAEFGIKVVGQVPTEDDLPDPAEYDGEYGDAYIVGISEPYEYYIFTRAFEGQEEPSWFDIGEFPQPGPQGIQGPIGPTPVISNNASAYSLNPGVTPVVLITKTGTDANPVFNWTFGLPQGEKGEQGIQGIQGIQGPQGNQGIQGIQGEKGDTGYLYTIIGQEDTEQDLPDPSTVRRDAAFLVGYQEPYDVYVIIGTTDLEWISLGQIATVEPQVYIASDTYAASGTLNSADLASIIASTDMHYIRDGSILFQRASTVNGVAYYTSIGIDTGSGATEIGYFALDLSDGSWEVSANTMPTDVSNYVTTNSAQTISGTKTFSTNPLMGGIADNGGTNRIIVSSGGNTYSNAHLRPYYGNTYDLGNSSYTWKDFYISGDINFGDNAKINKDSSNRVVLYYGNEDRLKIGNANLNVRARIDPDSNNTYDLGRTGVCWRDLYLSNNLTDGTNSIAIANIASKVTDTPQTATVDSSNTAKFTITEEGLYFFTYGNTQTFMYLTSSMLSSSLTAPIRVPCACIYNSSGDSAMGTLYIRKIMAQIGEPQNQYKFNVIDDSGRNWYSGFTAYLIKSNLL